MLAGNLTGKDTRCQTLPAQERPLHPYRSALRGITSHWTSTMPLRTPYR